MDGHGNHVTLENNRINKKVWVKHDHIAIVHITCITTIIFVFKKVKDATMSRSKHMESNKITLGKWVDQALKQSFIKQNIKSRFRITCIWPLNPKAMDNKTKPSKVYTTTNMSNVGSEEDYITKEKT